MIRLFLADDMPAVREVIRTGLAAAGRFEVVGEAGDGRTALSAIEGLAPDVIILDIDMPGMSGLDVVRMLRQRGNCAPVILCSSSEGPADSDLPGGVTEYLRKPFHFDSLTRAVELAVTCLVQQH
ncbi:MAG: two-component system response regulator [Symbiobacteriaceae bacterium]|jgi:CheY-like chemotaxis protein|nr:two-component system response regulator [Symbiobacteriaceae bacterium]